MSNLLDELSQKRQKIEDLQRQKAKQEGQRDQLLKQLKEKFDVSSVEEGKEKLDEMHKKLAQYKEDLEELCEQMERIIISSTVPEGSRS